MSLAQRQTPGFVGNPAATDPGLLHSRRCLAFLSPPTRAYLAHYGLIHHGKQNRRQPNMSPAQRAKGRAKMPSGKLPTRFQPYRTAAPRPPRFHRFTDLAGELRTLVYKHIAEQPDAIDVCGIWNARPSTDIVALFQTCRTIRDEAAHVFYSNNTFCFLEQCDQHGADHDDIEKSPWYGWLKSIGDKNAQSLRHVQLRIRDERHTDYYAKLIKELATRSPGITRLAIVVEKHATTSHIAGGARLIYSWEPNQVIQLTMCKLSQLVPSVNMFKHLNILMLAGREESQFLNKACSRFSVRLQVIDSADAKRDSAACQLLWDRKKIYDGVYVAGTGTQGGRVIRADDGDGANLEVGIGMDGFDEVENKSSRDDEDVEDDDEEEDDEGDDDDLHSF
ncbi:hypothetical protein QBC34DRAFT_334938 [Podospora aff. communis PSN243]|uniref:2EXR domain-containing protein n=1 Tax=Podospora aff. communis PSN243 TaxID=3040156 RepID=A0AAV9G7Y0_9PEZI|nr:hypothetical protein QBC34DRAFT_334938 [Podospora aff. communis PSN243]